MGEDPEREGLRDTPARVARMYRELLSGVGVNPASEIDAVFEAESRDPVVLRDIPFHSICEHHLLPFFGAAGIAYVPNNRVAGISKLARALDVAARRLQVQERLTGQVADAIFLALQPLAVVVELQAEHLCMSMRGIQKPGVRVVTSAVRRTLSGVPIGRDLSNDLLDLLRRR